MTWDEPVSPNGMLQYNITFEQIDLAREVTDEDASSRLVTVELEHVFNVTVRPYFNYTARVTPFTNAGEGETTVGFLLTEEACKYYFCTLKHT